MNNRPAFVDYNQAPEWNIAQAVEFFYTVERDNGDKNQEPLELPIRWQTSEYVKWPMDGTNSKINNSSFVFEFETNLILDPTKNKFLKMRVKKNVDKFNTNVLRPKTLIYRGLYAKRDELVWRISGSIPTFNTEKPRNQTVSNFTEK